MNNNIYHYYHYFYKTVKKEYGPPQNPKPSELPTYIAEMIIII